jgi:tRNA A37 threonylcarbamoyladenosine dehydratase
VAALARSGASHIRIIDFDQVSLSSLNRHSVATLADVGTPKVHCLRKRLQAIVPWCSFDCRNQLFSIAEADNLLGTTEEGRQPDWVIDAIDNIDSKVALLAYCHQRGLKVISSMGAGCKSDPTRIFIGDISTSSDDPLSRSCRRRLRAPPYGISSGIPVVYSSEKPGPGKASLLPLPEEEFAKGTVGDLAPMQDFRVRILPVLGTMPAVFGLACANHVILSVAGHPLAYVEAKGRDKMYDGILAQVQASEEKVAKFMAKEVEGVENVDVQGLKIPLTAADVGYVIEEVFRGKSVLSGVPTRLALVRWRRPETVTMRTDVEGQKSSVLRLEELVCMTKEEAQRHEKEVVRGPKTVEEMYDSKVLEEVRKRMEEERWYERFR